MRVSIHYCLTGPHKGEWSIIDRRGSVSPTNGRVIAYRRQVVLDGATFKVSEKRRQVVIEKRCREVHARVWGESDLTTTLPPTTTSVHYNPYRAATFTTLSGTPIYHARRVIFHSDGRCYI